MNRRALAGVLFVAACGTQAAPPPARPTPTEQPESELSVVAPNANASGAASALAMPSASAVVSASASGTALPSPSASAAATDNARVPNVANTVASMQRDFQTCFERQLEKDPSLKGSLRVRIVIGAAGDVKDVTSTAQGLNDAMTKCIESRVRAQQFAPVDGGPQATIILPLTFVADAAPPGSANGAKGKGQPPKSPPKKKGSRRASDARCVRFARRRRDGQRPT